MKAKARRRLNEQRRIDARRMNQPLPMDGPGGQLERAAERAEAHRRRYPVPPLYRMSYRHPLPVQPLCYQRSV